MVMNASAKTQFIEIDDQRNGVPIQGRVRADFMGIAEAFAQNFEPIASAASARRETGELGASFAVVQNGELIVELWGGYRDRARQTPWRRDDLVSVYSTTKPIAALVVALAMSRGELDLETPIADYWPEFAAQGKGTITLGEGMSHQAGVSGISTPIDPALWLDWQGVAQRLAAQEPLWPIDNWRQTLTPGQRVHGYHPLTFGWLVGEPVRRACKDTLGRILARDICQKLGADFHIGVQDADQPRCVEIQRPRSLPTFGALTPALRAAFLQPWSAPNAPPAALRKAEIPSANGHGTAAGIAKLYALFADKDALAQTPITQDAMNAILRLRASGEDLVLPPATHFAAGIEHNLSLAFGPHKRIFGHAGWGGSCAIADPALRLSACYVMNQQSPHLRGDPRATRLIEALYAGVD